jgi:CheY-like chemotaxis protein
MPLAEHIAPHLPNLRRFARLLTGSQKAGDTAVARLLEAIVADASVYPDLPPRVALYQCFLSAFTTRMEDPAAQADEIGRTAARSLAALPLQARQAFLLVSVEEFERKEAALILEVSESRIDDLLEQASKEIGRQIATDVLIIEDEPLIAMDLQRILQDLGHRVTSIARTHKDALKAAALQKPGLVLADIRLADGSSGLDAVNELLRTFEVPVVFITAYPERFLTGERPEPAFLISKPFQPAMVSAVASQALFFQRNSRNRAPRAAAS